jgi:DNA-binding SARP family transcriptional activator/tetratricopeptide (TPR) repeat protein
MALRRPYPELMEGRGRSEISDANRPALLDVRVLGTFAVSVDGRPISAESWSRSSAMRLFKLLLVTPGHRLLRESAAESLWPEMDAKHQAANLRKALHFARKAIGPDGKAIVTDGDRLCLDDSVELQLDLDHWRTAADRLRSEPGARADPETNPDVGLVVGLGGDDLLPDDPYEEWLAEPREHVALVWHSFAVEAARDAVARGHRAEAHELLDRLLRRDPADEEAHRLLIELLGVEGRHHAARRQFFRCRRELAEAFGVEPAAETLAALGLAETASELRSSPAASRGRLVGRESELARIDAILDVVASGVGSQLIVGGPVGIGKSRLIEHVLDDVRELGWRVLQGRAVENADDLTYSPLRIALRGLTRQEVADWPEPAASAAAELMPELGLHPAMRFAHPAALITAMVEAIDSLTTNTPALLAIDDAHWLDDGTATLLLELATRLSNRPLLLLIGLRTDEQGSATMERLLAGLARTGSIELEVGSLRSHDIGALVVAHLGGTRLDAAAKKFLAERSSGIPLYCLELARILRDEGRIELRGQQWSVVGLLDPERVPRSVTRTVRARSEGLDPKAAEVLALAAETGDAFRFDRLVFGASVDPERVLHALDDGLRVGLLMEDGAGYRFAHPLFRSALRRELGPTRRARLQLAVARSLAGDVDPQDSAAVAGALASGIDPVAVAERALTAAEAGLEEAQPLAIAFAFAAAQRQAALFQRDLACTSVERGLALWYALPDGRRSSYPASAALRLLGDLRQIAAREDDAAAAYRESIAAAQDLEDQGAAWIALSRMPYRHADYESTIGILEEGLAMADDAVVRAILHIELGWLEFRHQHLEKALAVLEEAERAVREPALEFWRMQALDCLSGPLDSLGRGEEAMPVLEEALAIALRRRDAWWEFRIRTHIGFCLIRAGTPGRARPHLDRALSLARMVGEKYGESVASWAAWEMEFALGNDLAAEKLMQNELTLLAEIGGNARHEAIAHTRAAHLARRRADAYSQQAEAALARGAAARAGVADPAFAARIEGYLVAPQWIPHSM